MPSSLASSQRVRFHDRGALYIPRPRHPTCFRANEYCPHPAGRSTSCQRHCTYAARSALPLPAPPPRRVARRRRLSIRPRPRACISFGEAAQPRTLPACPLFCRAPAAIKWRSRAQIPSPSLRPSPQILRGACWHLCDGRGSSLSTVDWRRARDCASVFERGEGGITRREWRAIDTSAESSARTVQRLVLHNNARSRCACSSAPQHLKRALRGCRLAREHRRTVKAPR
ncbi:hypothetical protein B0H21DRAFT_378257 [Amylocystis lapponica]|nr:hypothetical protein B0H21DRAFT_378257 [Amylocystis lapponica]